MSPRAGARGDEGEAGAVGRVERARFFGGVGDEEVRFAAGGGDGPDVAAGGEGDFLAVGGEGGLGEGGQRCLRGCGERKGEKQGSSEDGCAHGDLGW